MKEGLFYEDGSLIYYKHDHPYHAGVIEVDGDIYYISSRGRAVKGQHIVHGEMTNGILNRGTYTFGDDYKLVKGSYIAPKKHKKKKKKSTRQKLDKRIITVCLSAIAVVFVMGLGYRIIQNLTSPRPVISGQATDAPVSGNGYLSMPTFDKEVLLCSEAALGAYTNEMTVTQAIEFGDPYRPFLFPYALDGESATLLISEHADFSHPREFLLDPSLVSLAVDNLKTGTDYFYKVTVNGDAYTGTFRTARSTRFVYMDGVHNTRDIGGYRTLDGKTVRQGLLIRGTELDGLINLNYLLNKDAVADVQSTFGFVYDFDLRAGEVYQGNYQSKLGPDVPHRFYNSPSYGAIFQSASFPALQAIFRDLADPSKYPMYIHCTHGADRTGTIIFLLQGILNMSEEDMVREYQMTGFAFPGFAEFEYMQIIIDGVASYPGDTLQEKIVSFLTTEVGVTGEQIESIRTIFLEE